METTIMGYRVFIRLNLEKLRDCWAPGADLLLPERPVQQARLSMPTNTKSSHDDLSVIPPRF